MEAGPTTSSSSQSFVQGTDGDPGPTHIFMTESLFLLPESFDDETLEAIAQDLDNVDILYVAADMPEDVLLSEDESVAILANYGQVRKCLHTRVFARCFKPGHPPGGKPPRAGHLDPPRPTSLSSCWPP